MIDVVMTGVAGRFGCAHFEWTQAHDVVVLEDLDALRRDGCDLAPEFLHVVTESARGRFNQFRWIDEARRADARKSSRQSAPDRRVRRNARPRRRDRNGYG